MAEPAKLMDHRKAVAAERRERMRGRLLESAFVVFGQRGVDARVIDEVIGLAGVSRGTFYNYFRTNDELLLTVVTAIEREMLEVINLALQVAADPAIRVCDSVRLHFDLIRRFPAYGVFVDRGGLNAVVSNPLLQEYLLRDLRLGQSTGRFEFAAVEVAFDTVVGIAFAGSRRIHFDQLSAAYSNSLAAGILLALCLSAAEGRDIANRPLPKVDLPPESLFVRSSCLSQPEAS